MSGPTWTDGDTSLFAQYFEEDGNAHVVMGMFDEDWNEMKVTKTLDGAILWAESLLQEMKQVKEAYDR